MEKDKAIMNLSDFTQTEFHISCTNCNAEQATDGDEDDFYKKGWRATQQNCYCPKCAKKKLKQV